MLDLVNEVFAKLLLKIFGSRNERMLKEMWPIVAKINELEEKFRQMSDEQLTAKTGEFKRRIQEGASLDEILPEAFATVRETASRTIGLRHYDVQLIGGIAMHQGKIAEMITGEGKTLVATAPAYLNTLGGKHVHIVTVNDYLARRDRDWMGPVYEKLGLTVGCIQSEMDPQQRLREYASNITFGTNNEFGFDYLRDNMKMRSEDQCQGELYYAIIDEVDSVLVDEARTPLIISGPSEESTDKYYRADKIARKLQKSKHFELKEKEQMALLTEDGIEYAEKLAGVDSFYKGKNMDWPHHIAQALRAHHFFKLDREYVINDNEIVIVDEFTGRLQPGRRWSDGLHQAIEAKEGLKIREENQTLATITFQNYFRLYEKLAGMTGTALTEAVEFDKIYKLDVLVVPPNRTLVRKAHNDVIYGTTAEKFDACIEEIVTYHHIGRPLLVGTISIENSEVLSQMLDRRGVPHQVLNAKHHEKEAQIIAKAGQLARVTIATNMAGRGTDIVLGTFSKQQLLEHWQSHNFAPKKLKIEDPEVEAKLWRHWAKMFLEVDDPEIPLPVIEARLKQYWKNNEFPQLRLCESVAELGGLHVLGTERHEARRIDNQLRGRCGRQGDPGSSRFYLCFEDELLRKFAPPSMVKLMQRMGMQDGQEIQHPLLTRGIGKAQQRVEQYNFEIRKNLLEYDEVMDEQRKIVYSQRQKVLNGENSAEIVWKMIEERTFDALDRCLPQDVSTREWDFKGLSEWLAYKFDLKILPEELASKEYEAVEQKTLDAIKRHYQMRRNKLGERIMNELERYLLLEAIDSKWKDHLYAMDELKSGIGLQAMGQKDPKIEYKRHGYQMFEEMITAVNDSVTDLLFKLEFEEADARTLDDIWQPAQFSHEEMPYGVDREGWEQAQAAASATTVKTIRRKEAKVGRNEPCPCGSGRKYKKCCGKNI